MSLIKYNDAVSGALLPFFLLSNGFQIILPHSCCVTKAELEVYYLCILLITPLTIWICKGYGIF